MTRKLVALLIAGLLALGITTAQARTTQTWDHYRTKDGGIPVVVIKDKCELGEDSAAHLKLISYSHLRLVYGCYHHGY